MKVNRKKLVGQLEDVSCALPKASAKDRPPYFTFGGRVVVAYNDCLLAVHETDQIVDGVNFSISSEPLLPLSKKLTEDEIDVQYKDSHLIVRGKRKQAKFSLEETDDEALACINFSKAYQELPKTFLDGLSSALECVHKSEKQFVLACVHITPKWIEASNNYQAVRTFLTTGLDQNALLHFEAVVPLVKKQVSQLAIEDERLNFKNEDGLMLSC